MATPIADLDGKSVFGPPRPLVVDYNLSSDLNNLSIVSTTRTIATFPAEIITAIARHLSSKDLLSFRLSNVHLALKSFDAFVDHFVTEFKWSNEKRASVARMLKLQTEAFSHVGVRVKRLKIFSRRPSYLNPTTKKCNLSHLQNLRELRMHCIYLFDGNLPYIDWWVEGMSFPQLQVAKFTFPYLKDSTAIINFIKTHKKTLKALDLKGVTLDYTFGGWKEVLHATKALDRHCKLLISTPWALASSLPNSQRVESDKRVFVDLRLSTTNPYANEIQIIKGFYRGVSGTHYLLNPGSKPEVVDAMIAAHKFAVTMIELAQISELLGDPDAYDGPNKYYSEGDAQFDDDNMDECNKAPKEISDLLKILRE